MTFIKPDKISLVNKILLLLAIPLIAGAIWLIFVYNQVVSLNHEISSLKKEIELNQAATAELKEKAFKFYSSENVDNVISELNLIQEKNPEYFKIPEIWVFASQQ